MDKSSKTKFTPFRLLLLGRSGTGKTYNGMDYILELIEKKLFEAKRVIIMS